MAVVNLNDVELLDDAAIEVELLGLELGKHSLGQVVEHEEVQLGLSFEITLVSLDLVSDSVNISSALEHGAHCLLSGLNVLHVSLTLSDLFLESSDGFSLGLELTESSIERAHIIDLALDPVVKVSEWVPQVVDSVLEALNQVLMVLVDKDELVGLLVHVEVEVLVLVFGELGGCASVGFDEHLLLGQVVGHVLLHFLHERSGFLDEHGELIELSLLGGHGLLVDLIDRDLEGG